jgi:hypothetical protein
VEAKILKTNIAIVSTKFLHECILTRFGCPLTIIIDQGVYFINDAIKYLKNHFLLKHVSFVKGMGKLRLSTRYLGHY